MTKMERDIRNEKWKEVWRLRGKKGALLRAENVIDIFCGVMIVMALVFIFKPFIGLNYNETWKNILAFVLKWQVSCAVGIIPMAIVSKVFEKRKAVLDQEIEKRIEQLKR